MTNLETKEERNNDEERTDYSERNKSLHGTLKIETYCSS
jgi:hypothetical protein